MLGCGIPLANRTNPGLLILTVKMRFRLTGIYDGLLRGVFGRARLRRGVLSNLRGVLVI